MRTIFLLVIYFLFVILLIPVFLLSLVFGFRGLIIALSKGALRIGQLILGIRVEVSGFDLLEKGESYIFMANHLSILDGPLLFMLIPRPVRVILKKEAFRLPIIGQTMLHVGFVPVDRKHLRGGRKSITRAASMIREKGFSFLIFPEGTRSWDGKLQEFRRGGFFLALESGVSIVPVSIAGSFELMPRGSFFVKKGTVKVCVNEPISVKNHDRKSLPVLLNKVREAIQSSIGR